MNKHEMVDSPKIGVLLTNLGTPDAPTKAAVRPFLKELLSDPRVVGTPPPRWLWMLILNGIILNVRPRKSAKKYQSIWDTHGEGSPLLAISKKQKSAVKAALNKHSPGRFTVSLGMRYRNPSIASALKELESENCEKFLVLPHPEVLTYMRRKTEDYDRWLAGMQRLNARFEDAYRRR